MTIQSVDARLHGLPVEIALVLDASSIGQLGEVYGVDQRLQIREELFERRSVVGQGGKQ
jgi:hypothetical protein